MDIFNAIMTPTADSLPPLSSMMINFGFAVLFGLMVSVTYNKTHISQTPSQSFSLTLVVLPVVVAVIIMLVGNAVARAFSLAGAFAIIRFRSVAGDPRDITYVLFCMAIGLASGMGYALYAFSITALLCIVTILLHVFGYATPKKSNKVLKIIIPEDLNYSNTFDAVLKEYTTRFALKKVRTTELGSLYELIYSITMPIETNEKDMIDKLRCLNGNLQITLVMEPQADEF